MSRFNINAKNSKLVKILEISFLIIVIEFLVLLTFSVVAWKDAGFVSGWRLFMLVAFVIGTAGIVWVGWCWHKLGKEVTQISGRLANTESIEDEKKQVQNSVLEKLLDAINERFTSQQGFIENLTEQVESMRIQLRVSQRQKLNMESIIFGIRDAVLVSDQNEKLVIANETAGRLFGFDHKQAKYMPLMDVVGKNHREFVEFLRRSQKSKARHTRYELEIENEGQPRYFDCIVSCIFNEKQNVCGVIAVLHDTTKVKEAARMKNDFVSHVSHELKTPLASICAYSEMLVDGEANNEQMQKEFYAVIQSQAQRLSRLIEDILNISRIESGLIKVNKKAISLALMIKEQVNMIQSYAEEKHIQIIAPELIVYDQIYGDEDMIAQVIVNLLGNAVKYTPENGKIEVGIEVDEGAGIARVTIADTGVGIPEKDIPYVFDKFYRVAENKKQAKGTGLGLNLVKEIVEGVHGGKIFVRSEVGVGSTFGFELPLAKGEKVEGRN